MRRIAFLALLGTLAIGRADEPRTWTDRSGRTFNARIVACDALRATLDVTGRGKVVVPLSALTPEDAAHAGRWRATTPHAPLIDPECVPAWPTHATAGEFSLKALESKDGDGSFAWASPHFEIRSDLPLPPGIIRDLAAVFEATRAVVMAAPLGLHTGEARRKYMVHFFADVDAYARAGGTTASGGAFNGRELLVLLPNLGIKPGAHGLDAKHSKNLFILKHEVTHQLLRPWRWAVPAWLDEGFAECVASWPYTQGRYSLQNLDAAMHDYLLKWRRGADRRALPIIAPETLMTWSGQQWQNAVAAQAAYDHYNSAALLCHYFLRHDGRGDSRALATYFDALRRGVSPAEAEAKHLLRGRSRADLSAELRRLGRALALDIRIE